jgi:hypothetical protein
MKKAEIPPGFYVYVFRDLEGVPRYVGKGTGLRYADRSPYGHNCAVHLLLKSKKHMPVEIVASGLTEEEAYVLETQTIGRFGRQLDGGTLFNVSKGGRRHGARIGSDVASEMSLAEVTRLVGVEWLEKHRYVLPLTRPLYWRDD